MPPRFLCHKKVKTIIYKKFNPLMVSYGGVVIPRRVNLSSLSYPASISSNCFKHIREVKIPVKLMNCRSGRYCRMKYGERFFFHCHTTFCMWLQLVWAIMNVFSKLSNINVNYKTAARHFQARHFQRCTAPSHK